MRAKISWLRPITTLFILFAVQLQAQEAELWPPLLELYGPDSADGYLLPDSRATQDESSDVFEAESNALEEAEEEPSPVTIWSLEGTGFAHRGRRAALALTATPAPVPRRTRIYTGGSATIALGAPKRFFAVLQPSTALHSLQDDRGWRFTLLESQAHLRLSCLGEAPRMIWRDHNASIWQELRLQPSADADLFVERQGSLLEIYQVRGQSRFTLPTQLLLPGRGDGLLRELQDLQLTPLKGGRTRIDLAAGQLLRLEQKGKGFTLVLTLPQPQVWGPRILATAPQIQQEAAEAEKPLAAGLRALRLRIVEERTEARTASEESVTQMLAQHHYEEALFLLRRLADKEREGLEEKIDAIEALSLLRLHQTAQAKELIMALPNYDPNLRSLRDEQTLAMLRSAQGLQPELRRPDPSLAEGKLNASERYHLAMAWQRLDQQRSALDFWEAPISTEEAQLWERSRREWLAALHQDKPWSLLIELGIQRDTNAAEVPAHGEVSRSKSGNIAAQAYKVKAHGQRLLDHGATHQIALSLDLSVSEYQRLAFRDYGARQLELSLPIILSEVFAPGLELSLRPFLGRRQRGKAATVDAFGYDMSLTLSTTQGIFGIHSGYTLGLDPDPSGTAPVDVATGESGFASSQTFRQPDLGLTWHDLPSQAWRRSVLVQWSQLSYQSPLKSSWNRLIWLVRPALSHRWAPLWDSQLHGELASHHFANGSEQTASSVGANVCYQFPLRWHHCGSAIFASKPSAVYGTPMQSTIFELSSRFEW